MEVYMWMNILIVVLAMVLVAVLVWLLEENYDD